MPPINPYGRAAARPPAFPNLKTTAGNTLSSRPGKMRLIARRSSPQSKLNAIKPVLCKNERLGCQQ